MDVDDRKALIAHLRKEIWQKIKSNLSQDVWDHDLRLYDATKMPLGAVTKEATREHLKLLKEKVVKEGEGEGAPKVAHLESGLPLLSCFSPQYWDRDSNTYQDSVQVLVEIVPVNGK